MLSQNEKKEWRVSISETIQVITLNHTIFNEGKKNISRQYNRTINTSSNQSNQTYSSNYELDGIVNKKMNESISYHCIIYLLFTWLLLMDLKYGLLYSG